MNLMQWRHDQNPRWSRIKLGKYLGYDGNPNEIIWQVKSLENGWSELIYRDVRRLEKLSDMENVGDELILVRDKYLKSLSLIKQG